MSVTPKVGTHAGAVPAPFPLSTASIVTLLSISTALFTLFPSPLWRAARTDGHLLRFAFSYLAIVPLAAIALRHRHGRLRLDALVTIVAMVWGAKLVVTALLYQTVGPSRRVELHAPDPNVRAPSVAETPSPPVDAERPTASLAGRIVDDRRPVPGAIVSVCDATPSDAAAAVDRSATLAEGALEPSLLDATLGDRLTLGASDGAPHRVRGLAAGVSTMSVAVVPGRVSSAELTTLGTILLEADGRAMGAMVVFDHALHTRTDLDGRFRLSSVPIGTRALCVFVGATPTMHVVHAVVGPEGFATFDILGAL